VARRALTATATVDAIREENGEWFADLSVLTVNQNGEPSSPAAPPPDSTPDRQVR
jgi:hypothetical protein